MIVPSREPRAALVQSQAEDLATVLEVAARAVRLLGGCRGDESDLPPSSANDLARSPATAASEPEPRVRRPLELVRRAAREPRPSQAELMEQLTALAWSIARYLSYTASPTSMIPLHDSPTPVRALERPAGEARPLDNWLRALVSSHSLPALPASLEEVDGGEAQHLDVETRSDRETLVTLSGASSFLRLLSTHRTLGTIPGVLGAKLTRVGPDGADLVVSHSRDLDLEEAAGEALGRSVQVHRVRPGYLLVQLGGVGADKPQRFHRPDASSQIVRR